jgi:hypothetical protein
MNDKDFVNKLPIFFRNAEGKKPTEEDLEKVAEVFREDARRVGRADEAFPKGTHVRISPHGFEKCIVKEQRFGVVVGYSRNKCSVRVLWDGTKSSWSISPEFLEKTDAPTNPSEL